MTIEATPTGVRLTLHVQPGASRTAVVGPHGAAIKLRLAAPPVDGKANAALRRFVAQQCGVRVAAVRLVRGGASREKTVLVDGISVAQATERLVGDPASR
ncbi:MAG: DUF167 domain-containing protein [Gemmatimonadota bacterium]